jgi:hypothetical protein
MKKKKKWNRSRSVRLRFISFSSSINIAKGFISSVLNVTGQTLSFNTVHLRRRPKASCNPFSLSVILICFWKGKISSLSLINTLLIGYFEWMILGFRNFVNCDFLKEI